MVVNPELFLLDTLFCDPPSGWADVLVLSLVLELSRFPH